MVQWNIEPSNIKPLCELSDSLRQDLGELNPSIMALDFDSVVLKHTEGRQYHPSSVDSICTNGRGLFFIEFKAESGFNAEIYDNYYKKGLISPSLTTRFLENTPRCYREYIVVTADPRDVYIDSATTRSTNPPMPESLMRLNKTDSNNQGLFYDKVRYMSCSRFVKFANRTLSGSNDRTLLTKLGMVES